jgi:peptide/nickel transport system substrate-binding protein
VATKHTFPRPKRSWRSTVRAAVLVLGAVAVASVIGVAASKAALRSVHASNSLTIAIPSDPANLDVQYNSVAEVSPPLDNIYEALTAFDQRARVKPALAVSWKNLSATTWRFNLRSGVKFQNGEPFNAAAAVFSITRALNPASSNFGYYSNVKSAAAVKGANAIIVTTAVQDALLPSELTFLPMVPPNYVQNDSADYMTHAVGTGPYQFVSWTPGQEMVVKANPNWWGGKARYQTVTAKVITDGNVRLQSLRAGEVDFAMQLDVASATLIPQAFFPPSNVVCLIRFNSLTGLFSDQRLRQAANYAIDRKTIAKSLFGPFGRAAHGQMIGPASFGYDTKLGDYPYDPNKARSLLAAAGYKNQPITLYTYSGHTTGDRAISLAATDYLQKAGFNIQANILPFAVWRTTWYSQPRPDAAFVCTSDDGLTGMRPLVNIGTSTGIQSAANDPVVDRLVLAAEGEFNDAKRAKDIAAISLRLKNDAFTAPIASVDQIFGAQKNMYWKPRLDGLVYFNNVVKLKK